MGPPRAARLAACRHTRSVSVQIIGSRHQQRSGRPWALAARLPWHRQAPHAVQVLSPSLLPGAAHLAAGHSRRCSLGNGHGLGPISCQLGAALHALHGCRRCAAGRRAEGAEGFSGMSCRHLCVQRLLLRPSLLCPCLLCPPILLFRLLPLLRQGSPASIQRVGSAPGSTECLPAVREQSSARAPSTTASEVAMQCPPARARGPTCGAGGAAATAPAPLRC